MQTALTIAGWIATFAFLAIILVPWLRGRTHLVTSWNMFMAGSLNFIALGMIQNAAGKRDNEFPHEYITFIAAVFVFYGCAAVVYLRPAKAAKLVRPPRLPWPQPSHHGLFMVSAVLSLLGLGMGFIPFFGAGSQIFPVINGPIAIAGFATALITLYHRPQNFANLGLVACTGGAALFSALLYGSGRRELLAVLFAIPVSAYWLYFRHRPRVRTGITLAIGGLVLLVIIAGYATIRHQTRNETESGSERAIARLKLLPGAVVQNLTDLSFFGKYDSVLDGQNAVWAGMLTIKLVDTDGDMAREPLHLVRYIALNPIPRSLWPDKPKGLGRTLPAFVGQIRVTWGPSIIGHCFYDGGWPIVVLYGLICGAFFRTIDHSMLRDPDNPWKVAALASVCGHLLGFARGDCGSFGINILGGLTFVTLFILPFSKFLGRAQPLHPQPPGGH